MNEKFKTSTNTFFKDLKIDDDGIFSKKLKKFLTPEECAKDLRKFYIDNDIEMSTAECVNIIKNYNTHVNTLPKTSKERTEDKQAANDECVKYLFDNLDKIPLRFYWKGINELIALYIEDFENKIVKSPSILGSERTGFAQAFWAEPIINKFIVKVYEHLEEKELVLSGLEIASIIVDICVYNVKANVLFKVDEKFFKVFSFNKEDWKCTYLDYDSIMKSDDKLPTWTKFFKNIGNEEAIQLLCAWIWGVFDERCIKSNRQALWLHGEGFDGKSTLGKTISRIISGKFEDTSTGSHQTDIGNLENQFWATSFYGKSFAILNEIDDPNLFKNKAYKSKLHSWVGHDSISIEGKGKTPFTAVLYARLMLHSNQAPIFNTYEINDITRVIPVKIQKSHFKGLDYIGTENNSDFEEKLFEERFSFLKFCKFCFDRKWSPAQNLFTMTKEYQNMFMPKSNTTTTIDELSQYIKKGQKLYKKADVTLFIKFIAEKYYGMKSISPRDIGGVYNRSELETIRKRSNGMQIECVYVELSQDLIKEYENASKINQKIQPIDSNEELDTSKEKNTFIEGLT